MQLEAIKKERGVSVEDGTVTRDKTLAAILAENKAKKEEQFANVWKTMKQGQELCHHSDHRCQESNSICMAGHSSPHNYVIHTSKLYQVNSP